MLVTAVPKPTRTPKRPRTRVKPRNAKRHKREWTRAYHSDERVKFVRSLMCVACLGFGPGIVNAHIEGDGASRKASYTKIVPMHDGCHREWHQRGDAFLEECHLSRDELVEEAAATERRWQAIQKETA